MQGNDAFLCVILITALDTQGKLLPVVRGELVSRLITIRKREPLEKFYMVKKSVDYHEEQMTEWVTLGSWKNPRLMYHDISTIGEEESKQKRYMCEYIDIKINRKSVEELEIQISNDSLKNICNWQRTKRTSSGVWYKMYTNSWKKRWTVKQNVGDWEK